MIRNIHKWGAALALGLALFASSVPLAARGAGALVPRAFLPNLIATGNCPLNPQEAALLELMRTNAEQGRISLNCSASLRQAAYFHAQDMVARNYFDHVSPLPDRIGPNQMARNAGYTLPSFYDQSITGNNIESIGAGYATVGAMWSAWMGSPAHRDHLLGLVPFYAEQIDFGIAYVYAPASTYKHYWIVITARKGP